MSVWIDTTLAKAFCYVGLCTTEKLFHKQLRRMKMPRDQWPSFLLNQHANATAHQFEQPDGKFCVIVCMHPNLDRSGVVVAGLLVHEAVHIWQWHRESIGEKAPSSEYEAYAIQNLSQGLMEAYTAQIKGR